MKLDDGGGGGGVCTGRDWPSPADGKPGASENNLCFMLVLYLAWQSMAGNSALLSIPGSHGIVLAGKGRRFFLSFLQ